MSNPAFPVLDSAVSAWTQKLEFVLVGKHKENYKVYESYTAKKIFGFKAPLKPQEIAIKPEGQRKWRWQQIICLPSAKLNIDDIVEFPDKIRYRVQAREQFSEYGFISYHLVEDYEFCY